MPKRLLTKETATPGRLALGSRLTDERIARHWTRPELCKHAGVPLHIVNNMESGNLLQPAAEPIFRLAKTFNLRPEWLLDGTGEKFVPSPAEVKAPETLTVERVPIEMAKTLLKLVEELQYSRLFCPESLSVTHVERWAGMLLGLPELRAIGDHFMRAAFEADPAQPGMRPTLVVNNVDVIPRRTIETGVVLPAPEKQPAVVQKTAALRVPPASRSSMPAEPAPTFVFSLDPLKGDKIGKIRKGSYTEVLIRKRMPPKRGALLKQPDVCGLLGISLAKFWELQTTDEDFPKPAEILPTGKAGGYRREDFEGYLRKKLMERHDDKQAAHA